MASRSLMQRTIERVLPAMLFGAVVGCGADFDSPDKVDTLRVFAIQKDPPYAPPTTDSANPSIVNMTMLWTPGPHHEPSKVQRLWFSGCDDLPGDQYFSCLARMYALWKLRDNTEFNEGEVWSPLDIAKAIPTDPERLAFEQALVQQVRPDLPPSEYEAYLNTVRIAEGSTFQYPIPPRIVEYHRPSTDPSIPNYGVSFVFFTACAGTIDLAPIWKNIDLTAATQLRDAVLGFPFACYDDQRNQLGPDDFVSGYTQEFVYGDGSTNNNPIVGADKNGATSTVVFNGKDVNAGAYCIDSDCNDSLTNGPASPPVDLPKDICEKDTSQVFPHVKTCSGKCPKYDYAPTLDPNKNNDDTRFGLPGQPGSPKGEQMWINYYADRGELEHTVRLLRDVTEGWAPNGADKIGNQWTPPKEPGPVNFWSVVHDVRGGTSWVKFLVCVDN